MNTAGFLYPYKAATVPDSAPVPCTVHQGEGWSQFSAVRLTPFGNDFIAVKFTLFLAQTDQLQTFPKIPGSSNAADCSPDQPPTAAIVIAHTDVLAQITQSKWLLFSRVRNKAVATQLRLNCKRSLPYPRISNYRAS